MQSIHAFGTSTIKCTQPFPLSGETVEYFNADTLFKFTPHTEERVKRELGKIDGHRNPATHHQHDEEE